MAYELEEVRISQEIFYYLLEHHELREEEEIQLYKAYTEQEEVQNLVKSQGEIAQSRIERYGNVIYLIPREENHFLGFSKAQLKAALCKSSGTDKDYYLSQFAVLTLLVEFFDGQGSSSKAREYIRVGELQNCISARLREGAQSMDEEEEEQGGIAFSDMLEAYEALRSDDKGSRAKTTKEGFLHHILLFLQKQGLIEYVEQDEMIKTTKKLDNFMDWNLLNQNNYHRVLRVLGVTEDE
ncbi:MAG: hypothetical protein HFG85_00220 [Dorea sp.]|jgi:hypothetical protein|uniref:DUF6063 family protein n=1 Tax=Sporofaciens sp. JLR.KK001 TaxID=3112621 RepID=UPI002172C356|nr:hypothetical protein [Dorea sp.]